ncbi:MAG: phage tail tape measure protein [Deltaproteobacteria bacterium]|nr:phage tail tape measure protein [Deltaproteobacteria bacterium]
MALRSLIAEVFLRDKATAVLQGINSEMDSLKQNVDAVDTAYDDLSSQTETFSVEAQSAIEDVAESTEELGDETSSFGNITDRISDIVTRKWKEIGLAIGAAGAALEGYLRLTEDWEVQTRQIAILEGTSADVVRESTAAMTNHTFSITDALRARRALIRMGITETEQLNRILPLLDMYADATGKDIVEGAEMAYYALGQLGESIETLSEEQLDTFTFMTTRAGVETTRLRTILMQLGPDFRAMGYDLDDFAVLMAALNEQGMIGEGVTSRLSKAMREAGGDARAFERQLGLTREELDAAAESLENARGITAELAQPVWDAATPLERLQFDLQKLGYTLGVTIRYFDWIPPVLTSIASLMGIISMAQFMTGTKTVLELVKTLPQLTTIVPQLTAAISSFGVTLLASPITWIVVAIGGLIAVLVVLYTQVDWVREAIDSAFGAMYESIQWFVSGIVEAWKEHRGLIGAVATVFERLSAEISDMVDTFVGGIQYIVTAWSEGSGVLGKTLRLITAPFEILLNLIEIAGALTWAVLTGDIEPLKAAFSDFEDTLVGIWDNLIIGIIESIKDIDWLQLGKNIILTIGQGMLDAATNVYQTVAELVDIWDNLVTGIIESIRSVDWIQLGKDIILGIGQGMLDAATNVYQTVADIGGAIADGIAEFFGISSPSRLMIDYGINISEGLSQGMKEGAEHTYAPESDFIPALPRMIGPFAPTVNISISGVGGSPEEIAHTVDKRLRQTFDQYAHEYFKRQLRRR